MNGTARHINELVNNPCVNAFHMYAFYETYGDRERGLLAAYLVYPFVLHPDLGEVAERWRRTPHLLSVVDKHAVLFADFAERLERFRSDTVRSLELLAGAGAIELTAGLGVRVGARPSSMPKSPAARKLALLIRGYSLPAIYRTMGVSEL